MISAEQLFPYTAHRRACYSFAATFTFVLLLEAGMWAFLVVVLAPSLILKVVLLGTLVAINLFAIFGLMLAPLWTKHRLTKTHLYLHYGFDKMTIPLADLMAAQPVQERHSYRMRAEYQAHSHRIVAAFSEQGQVLLRLNQRHRFHVNRADVSADRFLVNVDHRDAFLAALGLPEKSVPQPANRSTGHDPWRPDAAPARSLPISPPPSLVVRPTGAVAIGTKGLSRRYGDFVAVEDLNLAIQPGEIYGFLGPNGAGKTTTIKMLVGLIAPTTGSITIAGHDLQAEPVAAKTAFGYVPDRAILYDRLSGREFLSFLAQLRGIGQPEAARRIDELLHLLELADRADGQCGTYSFGMKRKLVLAGALLHRPPVLILDEPLNGLDPRSARRLKDLFLSSAAEGVTVLLSTHDLTTAEAVCHRVGIINHGRLVAEGSASQLRRIAEAPDLEAVFLSMTEEKQEVAD